MKKIVLIRSLPFTRDIRIKKEALSLRSFYDVSVIMWDRDGSLKDSDIENLKIKRFPLETSTKKKTTIYMPLWWLFIVFNLIGEKWDYVHAADFDTFFPAIFICKLRKIPIIYDIVDFYSDTVLYFSRVLSFVVATIDKFLMNFADAIILPDKARLEQVGLSDESKVYFIVNSPSSKEYKDLSINYNFKREDRKLNLFFGGGVSPERGIDFLCEAVKESQEFYLRVIGPAPYAYRKFLYATYNNCKNIDLHLKAVPHETIINETMNADVTFALYDPNVPNNRYASPNKLYEAMMCSKPIIVSDNTTMANIVREEKCGLIVPYGNVEKLKEVLNLLKESPNLRKKLGKNGKKAYENSYNWEIMEKRLLAIYENL
ncbi:glycosyltransferase [Methanothermobacter sp. CaT2]|uniref:glycosyltransferase family 4 protein n=1 Tax=Methanothermobacter sp. CaT2 TaxID=866790 RepID=UPI0002CCF9A4|nr:glycosyltransferase family 4 protein [Methanothermobacter sp. CaT2]BAM69534.1 glycosyltransferase [Methanothermobacter sp. CaT2]